MDQHGQNETNIATPVPRSENAGNDNLKILLLHGYSGKNIGDIAILKGTIDLLDDIYGSCQYTLASTDNKKDINYESNISFFRKLGITVIPAFFPGPKYMKRIGENISLPLQAFRFARGFLYSKWCQFACILLGKHAVNVVGPVARTFIKSILVADIIISKGGGFFYGYGFRGELFLRRMMSYFLVARALGKKVGMYGNTVGPFVGNRTKNVARSYLKKVDYFYVREEHSRVLLEELGITKNVTVIPDLAFALAPDEMPDLPPPQPLRIALTTRNWPFPSHNNGEELKEKLENAIASCLDLLIEKYKPEIHFIPHSNIDNIIEDDAQYIDKIANKMKCKNAIIKNAQPTSMNEMIEFYRKIHLTIGMRLHSLVLSSVMRVPFVGIVCERPKMHGTMKLLKMEHLSIEADALSSEGLYQKVIWALENMDQIRSAQNERVRKFKSILRKSAVELGGFFDVKKTEAKRSNH